MYELKHKSQSRSVNRRKKYFVKIFLKKKMARLTLSHVINRLNSSNGINSHHL